MARPLTVHELIPELQFWIKHPTDPSLRKLLRKTVQTLEAFNKLCLETNQKFVDLVGEPEPSDSGEENPSMGLPSLPERVKEAE